jgi:nitrogen fixation protein NifU and related proteins
VTAMDEPLRQLYQAIIVEHSRAPRRRGPLPGATHEATIDNPLCGDQVTLRLLIDGDEIRDAAFEGQGCALSLAAASLLASRLAGAPLAEARALVDRFSAFVQDRPGAPEPPELGELSAFAGVREFRSRQACALLPAQAFARALRR